MSYEITIQCSPTVAVEQVAETLRAAGFRVKQFFNLQVASKMHSTCDCPHHGTAQCTCQVAVLLVYHTGGRVPLTLMIHGHDDQSLIIFADNLPTDLDLQADVFECLRQVNLVHSR